MTVKELIARLNEMPQDAIVVASKDAEGNDFSPVASLEVGVYMPRNGWAGEWIPEEPGDSGASVCLWPTN
jgi:hypothetical protein